MYSAAWVKHTAKRIILDQNVQLWTPREDAGV